MFNRYTPSLKKNNELRDEFTKSYKALIYKIEKGKVHPHLDQEELKPIVEELKTNLDGLTNSYGTGKENINDIYGNAKERLKDLEKSLNQELVSEVEDASDDVIDIVDCWKDVLSGDVEFDEEEFQQAKVKRSKARIIKKLNELGEIKSQFVQNEKRLESEITQIEKSLDELNNLMIKENNERRINEIFRKISAFKTKIDTLNIRRNNYSACYEVLDLVYANAKELIEASDYTLDKSDLAKAKAFLNIDRLRKVLNDPKKTLFVLKKMDEDIKSISEKTKLIDDKIGNIGSNGSSISAEALAYKEKLLADKKMKESLNDLSNTEIKVDEKEEIKGEK